jgi:hypothetical protein
MRNELTRREEPSFEREIPVDTDSWGREKGTDGPTAT